MTKKLKGELEKIYKQLFHFNCFAYTDLGCNNEDLEPSDKALENLKKLLDSNVKKKLAVLL